MKTTSEDSRCTCPDTWNCPQCVYACERCSDEREATRLKMEGMMDYEAEDKGALMRATLNLAKDAARQAGGAVVATMAGRVPINEFLSSGPAYARDGWVFELSGIEPDGRIGIITERGWSGSATQFRAVYPVY